MNNFTMKSKLLCLAFVIASATAGITDKGLIKAASRIGNNEGGLLEYVIKNAASKITINGVYDLIPKY